MIVQANIAHKSQDHLDKTCSKNSNYGTYEYFISRPLEGINFAPSDLKEVKKVLSLNSQQKKVSRVAEGISYGTYEYFSSRPLGLSGP